MLNPRFNLWIEKDGAVVISRWRSRLLRAIDETGSITAAAAALKVPYRRAWERIQEMERSLDEKLVSTEIGGSHGGGAELTPSGKQLLERFEDFARGFDQEIDARFNEVFG